MKKWVIVLVAALLLLTGCQAADTPIINECLDPGPPFAIRVNSITELQQLKEIVESKDEKKLQEANRAQSSTYSVESIVEFVDITSSLPVLKILDGEITEISYTWREERNWDASGNLESIEPFHETVYITMKAANGSRVAFTYSLDAKGKPIEDILESFDQEKSSLQKPFQAIDNRCFVYHETRDHQAKTGEVITWYTVIDGIPVRIRYDSENTVSIKAETVFQNAAIITIP